MLVSNLQNRTNEIKSIYLSKKGVWLVKNITDPTTGKIIKVDETPPIPHTSDGTY